ncbi:DUF721 domain-containing protein [Patescibacteria group bacterium]|nr:DUF721 domain-containing protein [Patescibacteria group bacterium]MBU1703147.1 DUF721 domain-containing protein [Patescibacteria group bacterium]MBU1953644.1 DUF721 domain-containing protein [Patescibacteria group bacterium]
MWDSIQNLLPKAAGKYNFAKALKAIEICKQYKKIAGETLPPAAAESTFPKSYKDAVLTLGALNSAWAQQLQMNKHRIHRALAEKFGSRAIKKIKIEITENMPGEHHAENTEI